jgi:chorismate-pyruvate lyase
MTGAPQPSTEDLAAVLARHRGTVTEFLEHVAGEPVDADIVSQQCGPAVDDDRFGFRPVGDVLSRAVLLTGRATRRRFVYAESAIAAERLPGSVRRRLEASRDPIGRVLADHHLRIRREPLADPVITPGISGDIRALLRGSALARRYRIIVGSAPAMVVSEWFLQSVPDALFSHPGW